jgi:tRNA A37 methylthiotransferase MiaB
MHEKHCPVINEFEFVNQIYKRMPVQDAVNQLKECSIVGFSSYVWNERLSLRIAKEIKRINPSCLVVFGGPQVPDTAEGFLRQHRFIDLAVHGEGEHIFMLILQQFKEKNWEGVPSLSYLDGDNFVFHPKSGRFKTLDEIPSPYLAGTFDKIIENSPNATWLALWETNRGCPFSCTYCDWGSATQAKVSKFDMSRLQQEVDWFAAHKIEFVFCCDANYGILPRDIEITQFVVDSKQKTGYPKALSVQNTKNATERSYIVQKLLSDGGLNKGVTLSVQSMDKVALTNIKRENISLESYQELQRRFMRDKVETYSDMILALPGETYDSFMDGMNQIIENGQHNRIQFNNLSILPNAEMGNPEYQKKFGMISIPSKIINMHGSLDEMEDESVQEMQMMVVGTTAMPKEDWIRVRASCWMSAFLHFDKLLQIPLVIFNKQTGINYRQIFEAFMDFDMTMDLPVLDEARRFFISEAYNLQNGGSEFVQSKKWLNLFWPADEYFFIKMVAENKLHQFYTECHLLLYKLAKKHIESHMYFPAILEDAIKLNRVLIKAPFQIDDETIDLRYNIIDYYKSIIENVPNKLEEANLTIIIEKSKHFYLDWNEWLQKVVWYGNKKGGYLHGNYKVEPQLAGHY